MKTSIYGGWLVLCAMLALAPQPASAAPPARVASRYNDGPGFMTETAEPASYPGDMIYGQGYDPGPPVKASLMSLWQPPPEIPGSESDACGGCSNCGDMGCGGCCGMGDYSDCGSCDSCGSCDDCNSCNDYCFNGTCCSRQGAWYGGGDYLLVRPHFSQGTAYYVCTTSPTTPPTPPATETFTSQSVEFNYQYKSAYRAFLGYHLWDCGGDVLFTYWNMTNTAAMSSPGATNDGTTSVNYCGQMGTMTTAPGQVLTANNNNRVNIFDLDFAKCLAYGGPTGPCECGGCPRWDLRWSAGVRGAQINRNDNNAVINTDGTTGDSATSSAVFNGAGPRLGIQGRRYLWNGRCSIFARGSQALLLGTFTQNRNALGADGLLTINRVANERFSRLVPVTDIEIGASYQVTPRFFFSAGWFFQAWWDMGFGEVIYPVTALQLGPLDTANIMAWDGLFVRGEYVF